MIKVDILECTENMESLFGFTKGDLYYGRRSLNGDYYLILNDEEKWIQVKGYKMTRLLERGYQTSYMKEKTFILVKNKKALNTIIREYTPNDIIQTINEVN